MVGSLDTKDAGSGYIGEVWPEVAALGKHAGNVSSELTVYAGLSQISPSSHDSTGERCVVKGEASDGLDWVVSRASPEASTGCGRFRV